MRQILNQIPGFRSNVRWKKIIASFYYIYSLLFLKESLWTALTFLLLPIVFFSFIDIIKSFKLEKSILKKTALKFFILFICFIISASNMPNNSVSNRQVNTNQTTKQLNNNKIESSDTNNISSNNINTNNANEQNNTNQTVGQSSNNNVENTNTVTNNINEQNTTINSTVPLTKGIVTRVVDGDTAVIKIDNTEYKVRFIGVNTPESTTRIEPYGKEASNYTKSKLTNKTVYLEKDVSETDKYGRLLRYIWLEPPTKATDSEIRTKMFNAILVLNGYAQAATYPPDVKYADYFKKYTLEARERNVGLWALGTIQNSNNTTKSSNINNQSNSKDSNKTVYWTPNGKSYHYKKDCKTLSRSKTIIEGTLKEAIDLGKSDPCDICVH